MEYGKHLEIWTLTLILILNSNETTISDYILKNHFTVAKRRQMYSMLFRNQRCNSNSNIEEIPPSKDINLNVSEVCPKL